MKKLIILVFFSISFTSYTQSCPTCNSSIYVELTDGGTVESPNQYKYGRNNTISNSDIFEFEGNGVTNWSTNSTIRIKGIVVNPNLHLILGTDNDNGNTNSFSIEGISTTNRGCVIVKSGAILDLKWITGFKYVDICVEDGGKIIFDSDNDRSGLKNTFTFNDVNINLQGPNALLEFGNSFIEVIGNLSVVGWNGDVTCPSRDSPNPSPYGSSGNISWNVETVNICEILYYKVLPIDYINFSVKFDKSTRSNIIQWTTLTETDNLYFILQRSENSIDNFKDISTIDGMLYSHEPINYKFIDTKLPLNEKNIYYRFKYISLFGEEEISSTIYVKIPDMGGYNTFRAYPNPYTNTDIKLELLNSNEYNGEPIRITLYSNKESISVITDLNSLTESLQKLITKSSSVFSLLNIEWGDKSQQIKLLKK